MHGDLHTGSVMVTQGFEMDPEFAFYGPVGLFRVQSVPGVLLVLQGVWRDSLGLPA